MVQKPLLLTSAQEAEVVFTGLMARAEQAGLVLRPPPPFPETCCGRGCNGCVWEGFYATANYWQEEALQKLS